MTPHQQKIEEMIRAISIKRGELIGKRKLPVKFGRDNNFPEQITIKHKQINGNH